MKFLAVSASALLLAFVLAIFNPGATGSSSAHACGVPNALSLSILNQINENKPEYQAASAETQVPWELLAAIHYRETSFSRVNPSNGQGIFQFVNGDGGPYPTGPVSDAEFERQLTFMANRLQDDYVWRTNLNYPVRRLKANNEDAFRIKDVLFSYNGRASVYAQQAEDLGFNQNTQPYEGSPYVMNRFDCARVSMGIITQDFGNLDGNDTRYGAFTLYNELTGGGNSVDIDSIVSSDSFTPGYILSNGVFNDTSRMSLADVQNFLDNLVPSCDVNGVQPSEFGGGTRAQFATASGFPPPFTCVNEYYENTTTHANNLNGNPIPANATSAAEIIWNAATSNGINPEVLLATIEKEKDILTDDWPWESQYRVAAGLTCSGSTSYCEANEYGFYNQVNLAAEKLAAGRLSSATPYTPGALATIPYSASCSGANVYVQNGATAAIYNYSTYQPNSAALNNLYGNGDSCSSYGVRDFWTNYINWFSFERTQYDALKLASDITIDNPTPAAGETVTVSYSIVNDGSVALEAGRFGVCARLNGQWFDFGTTNMSFTAGQTRPVSLSKTLTEGGTLEIFTCSRSIGLGGWASDTYPSSNSFERAKEITVFENPILISSLELSKPSPVIGDTVTASFTVQNTGDSAVTVPKLIVAGRDPENRNVDFPAAFDVTIPANGTYTYSQDRHFNTIGGHDLFIAQFTGSVWRSNRPAATSSNIERDLEFTVRSNPLLTSSLSLSPAVPVAGELVTATMTFTNFGDVDQPIGTILVAGRDATGRNVDFPAMQNAVVPANSTLTYSQSRTFEDGNHTFFTANFNNGKWSQFAPASVSGSIARKQSVNIGQNPFLITNLNLSSANHATGESVNSWFRIENTGSSDVTIDTLLVAARNENGNNVDFPAARNVVIPAGGTYTYSRHRAFATSGEHTLFIASFNNGKWSSTEPVSSSSNTLRSRTLNITP